MKTPAEVHADQVLESEYLQNLMSHDRARLHAAIVEAVTACTAPALPRFDGAAVWRSIAADDRDRLGALLIEWGFATLACEAIGDALAEGVVPRAMAAASILLELELLEAVAEDLPQVIDVEGDAVHRLPIPTMVGQVCAKCGCTNQDGCAGCHWVGPDLCSACVAPAPRE